MSPQELSEFDDSVVELANDFLDRHRRGEYKMQGYMNSKGNVVGKFFVRKLRSNPPRFGVARAC